MACASWILNLPTQLATVPTAPVEFEMPVPTPEIHSVVPIEHVRGTPNKDERIVASPLGSFKLKLWTQDVGDPEPFVSVAVSNAGKFVNIADVEQRCVFRYTEDENKLVYYFVVDGTLVQLGAGTFEVAALANHEQVATHYVTIKDSPFLPGGVNTGYTFLTPDEDA